jgi:hypothetical protein
LGQSIIGTFTSVISKLISASKDEEPRRTSRSPVENIAHEIFEYADETVAHAEGVSRDELMLETYHQLGMLLAQWAKKLDKVEIAFEEPDWLKKYVRAEEQSRNRSWVEYGTPAFGFEVDKLFFAKEKTNPSRRLTEDLLTISEPYTMWMEDFKELVSFCQKNNLDFYVDGFNTRLPGRSFRVVIYKPKSGPVSHRDFREVSLIALQVFSELYAKTEAAISWQELVKSLQLSANIDEAPAERILEALLASGRIPKSKIST